MARSAPCRELNPGVFGGVSDSSSVATRSGKPVKSMPEAKCAVQEGKPWWNLR